MEEILTPNIPESVDPVTINSFSLDGEQFNQLVNIYQVMINRQELIFLILLAIFSLLLFLAFVRRK